MRIFTAVLFAGWMACSSTPSLSTVVAGEFTKLTSLLHQDWDRVTTSVIMNKWPRKLVKRISPNADCAGTVMLSDASAVNAEDCQHCDTFLFDQIRLKDTGCSERLSAVTLIREVADESAAEDLGKKLRHLIQESSPEAQVTPYEYGYTVVSWPSLSVNQTARFDIERSGGHIRTRLLIFRTSMSEAGAP